MASNANSEANDPKEDVGVSVLIDEKGGKTSSIEFPARDAGVGISRVNSKRSDMTADKEERELSQRQLGRQDPEETILELKQEVARRREETKVIQAKYEEMIVAIQAKHAAEKEEMKVQIHSLQRQLARQKEEKVEALAKVPQEQLKQKASEEKKNHDERNKQEREQSLQSDAPGDATPCVEQTRPTEMQDEDGVSPPGDYYAAERKTTGGTDTQNQKGGYKELQAPREKKDGDNAKIGQEKPTEKTHVDRQIDLNQEADNEEPTEMQNEVAGPKEIEPYNGADQMTANVLHPTFAKEDTGHEQISDDLPKGSHISSSTPYAATQAPNAAGDQSMKGESDQLQGNERTEPDVVNIVKDATTDEGAAGREKSCGFSLSKQEREWLSQLPAVMAQRKQDRAEREVFQEKLTKNVEEMKKEWQEKLDRQEKGILELTKFLENARKETTATSKEMAVMKKEWQGTKEMGSQNQSELSDCTDDVVILVMGSTGTGKSSFIKLISGNDDVHVGDSLKSATRDIQEVRFVNPSSGRNVVLVDTPGFDDSNSEITDTDILKKITEFLLEQYDADRKLNGLVYVQRISDPRLGGQSNRDLRMFKGLCGSEAYENIVVLTTNWDRLRTKEDGEKREAELKDGSFKDLVDGRASFMRHEHNDKETARGVLEHILTLRSPTHVRIQTEIRVERKTLEQTTAGSVRCGEIERLIAKQKKEVADLQEEKNKANGGAKTDSEDMKKELDKLERQEKERSVLKAGLDEAKIARPINKDALDEKSASRSNEKQLPIRPGDGSSSEVNGRGKAQSSGASEKTQSGDSIPQEPKKKVAWSLWSKSSSART